MGSIRERRALVIGASSGVGRATARALAAEGAKVIAVARGQEKLAELAKEVEGVETVAADAADPATANRLIGELGPELVVLAAGVRPEMGPLDELSWESFSEAWNSDMKALFHCMQAAVRRPLPPGSTFVVVSSGAAINGSHLSGGYAGAKRMQWMLAGYGQTLSNTRKLGIRFLAVVPKQLIEGTEIARVASTTYGQTQGTSGAEYMKRFEVPMDADTVAAAILSGLRGEIAEGVTAIGVTGKGVETLA